MSLSLVLLSNEYLGSSGSSSQVVARRGLVTEGQLFCLLRGVRLSYRPLSVGKPVNSSGGLGVSVVSSSPTLLVCVFV